ncbi:MAG: hypothetical protein JNM17_21105 [Archangium sp.]|nr:hypothetical protein [Archangium sp.]
MNAAGGITAEEFGNQAMTTRVFDEAYRLSYQETSQRPLLGGAQTTPFQRLKYEYAAGSVLEARHDPSKQLSEYFQHDFLGRLTQRKVVQTTGAQCRGAHH